MVVKLSKKFNKNPNLPKIFSFLNKIIKYSMNKRLKSKSLKLSSLLQNKRKIRQEKRKKEKRKWATRLLLTSKVWHSMMEYPKKKNKKSWNLIKHHRHYKQRKIRIQVISNNLPIPIQSQLCRFQSQSQSSFRSKSWLRRWRNWKHRRTWSRYLHSNSRAKNLSTFL